MMKKATYRKLREKALKVMEEKIAEHNEEIARIQKFIDGLDALYGDDGDAVQQGSKAALALMIDQKPGITDGITTVLSRKYPAWLTPLRVRSELAMLGMPLDHIANPMASVHAILKRFESRGWIEPKTENGETSYRWIPIEKRKA